MDWKTQMFFFGSGWFAGFMCMVLLGYRLGAAPRQPPAICPCPNCMPATPPGSGTGEGD